MDKDQKQEEIKNIIQGYLIEGMSKKDAARMAGISEATFYRWIEEDESFESRIEASILEYKRSLIKIVNACAEKDGRLALELFKRRFPEDNGIRDAERERGIKSIEEIMDNILEGWDPEKDGVLARTLSDGVIVHEVSSQTQGIAPNSSNDPIS